MEIDEEAVEIVRNHEEFTQSHQDRLFTIDPISGKENVFYLCLRENSWSLYGYKGNDKVELPEMRPPCIKEVKSRIRGLRSEKLEKFL